jgi:hypothetical protein
MEVAAYVCPLTEFGLQELGRLAVNFGHIEQLLDWWIRKLANLAGGPMSKALISPLATRRKLEIINAHLDRITNAEARDLVSKAAKKIELANGLRNDLLHGYWSFDVVDAAPVSRTIKKSGKASDAAKISETADETAVATRLLFTAMLVQGGLPIPHFPVLLSSGEGPPPPGWPTTTLLIKRPRTPTIGRDEGSGT